MLFLFLMSYCRSSKLVMMKKSLSHQLLSIFCEMVGETISSDRHRVFYFNLKGIWLAWYVYNLFWGFLHRGWQGLHDPCFVLGIKYSLGLHIIRTLTHETSRTWSVVLKSLPFLRPCLHALSIGWTHNLWR